MKSWATPTKLSYTQSLTTQKKFFPLPEIKYCHLPLAVGKNGSTRLLQIVLCCLSVNFKTHFRVHFLYMFSVSA